jgi:hypothetical protein
MYIYYLIYFIKLFIFVINCYFFENILLDEIKIKMKIKMKMMKLLIILQIKYYVYVYVELYCMGMYVKFVLY